MPDKVLEVARRTSCGGKNPAGRLDGIRSRNAYPLQSRGQQERAILQLIDVKPAGLCGGSDKMGPRGFEDATHAVSDVTELARRTSISSPSASSWSNVPAQRVLSVAAVMDVAREILWPDPCDEQPAEIDDVDAGRAQEYSLLAMLLAGAPDAPALSRLAKLDGDGTPLGLAHLALARAADNASAEKIEREFFDLFIGIGRGELFPYGSYYLTGFLNERPLARLRRDRRTRGIERAERQLEPENHAAILCEIMSGLAVGQFAATAGVQQLFFEKHLALWISRFFADLERAEAADFYRHVGTVGRLFMEIEGEAFRADRAGAQESRRTRR
jgi:TorA maturation chaperone TorD